MIVQLDQPGIDRALGVDRLGARIGLRQRIGRLQHVLDLVGVDADAAVLDDVWDEYVSIEGAQRDYGVVITGSLEACTLALDLPATVALRANMKGARS